MDKLANKQAVIAIAGIVGVGKTSLAKTLADKLNFKIMYENVEENPYLDNYYKDFKSWSFHLQVFFLAERFKAQKKMFSYGGGFIMDRTVYEDKEIFAKMNFDNGTMTSDDWRTYSSLFEAMIMSPYFEKPDLIVYLEGNQDLILERIKNRGREMELKTDLNYWKELDRRYSEWIETLHDVKVLRVNIEDYDVNDEQSIDVLIEKMRKVISN